MILQTFVVLDFLNTKAPGEKTSTSETTTPAPVLPKVCMISIMLLADNYFTLQIYSSQVPVPVVLKDILERSVVGIGSGTDYIPETLIHENGRVGK